LTLKPFQYQFFWQKTLECTQETLSETNENLQQAKYSIEERDFVIANQQEAGQLLITINMLHFNFIIVVLVLFNHLNSYVLLQRKFLLVRRLIYVRSWRQLFKMLRDCLRRLVKRFILTLVPYSLCIP
jgi:hypothetical protein